MQIVYDNIIYSLQKAGGISVYWSEITKKIALFHKNIVFNEYPNNNIFNKNIEKNINRESHFSYKIMRYLSFKKKIDNDSIFHSSYYRISKQKDVANITTVHDFTYEYFVGGLKKLIHSLQKTRAINNSDGIICISENTKKDLLKFYPDIDRSKIVVIYNGVGEEFKKLEKPSQKLIHKFKVLKDKKYILYIGDRSNYKNFDKAVETVNQLQNYNLVIVGGVKLNDREVASIKNTYFHFQGISGNDLNILYNNAFCFLYPSSYEGFGIPIVEAMKAGCPVLCLNRSSIPEVAGDAGLLVDDTNPYGYIKEILKLENNSFRDKVISRGLKQAKKFNWDRCANETYQFYKKILKKKFG